MGGEVIEALKRLTEVSPISTWALFGAGVARTITLIGMVLIIWLGTWGPDREKDRLLYIAVIAMLNALDVMAVIVALAKARVSARGPGGMNFDLSSGGADVPSGSAATVTTTTEIKP